MKRISLLVAVLLAFSGSSARGEIFYDIYFRGNGLDNNNVKDYTLNLGGSTTLTGVEIVLRETVTNGSTTLIGVNNINSYAVDVRANAADGSFNTLTLNESGGFPGGANDADTLNYVALGAQLGTPGRNSTVVSPGVREALLGTLNIVAPSSGTTTFTLSDFSALDGDFTTFGLAANTSLESLARDSGGGLFGQRLAIVVAVPEPSSFVLAGLAAGGMLFWRRRSKKQA